MTSKRKPVCMLCGKPSPKSICDSCAQRVQGEQTHRKQKEQRD
jgi:predicted amidophosphoribosyltransferase